MKKNKNLYLSYNHILSYFIYQLKKKPIDSNASIFQNRLPFPEYKNSKTFKKKIQRENGRELQEIL